MAIIAKAESDNFEQPPTGTIQAVCVFVHDIGMQPGEFQGKPLVSHKIIVSWELNEDMKLGEFAGKPFMMNKYYTLSLSEKANLRKDLESWRGQAFTDVELEGFDVESIKGKNCFLSIVATEKGKRKIAGVSALPKNTVPIKPTNFTPSDKFMTWIEKERAKAVKPTVDEHEAPPMESEKDDLPF
jgi:hypothetical protein